MMNRRLPMWVGTALLAACLATGCRHTSDHDELAGAVVDAPVTDGTVILPATPTPSAPSTLPSTPMPPATPMLEQKLPLPRPVPPTTSDKDKKPAVEPGPVLEDDNVQPVFHRTRSVDSQPTAVSPAAAAAPAVPPSMQMPTDARPLPGANDKGESQQTSDPGR